jgi:hypothetical protein
VPTTATVKRPVSKTVSIEYGLQSLDIHDPSDHYNQGRSSIVYIIICSAWTSVHDMQQ